MRHEREWCVLLAGDRLDLAAVAKMFHAPSMNVAEVDGQYYLRSARFDSVSEASAVASLTARMLPILNGIARPSSACYPGIKAVSVIATDPNGNQVAVNLPSPVFAWGVNDSGQLALPGMSIATVPTQVQGLASGIDLSAGNSHALAIQPVDFATAGQPGSGTVLAWGSNAHGELGIGPNSAASARTPVAVIDPGDPSGLLTRVTAVAAGGNHSLALKVDGSVWAWGFNSNGQLGDGTRDDRFNPVRVVGLEEIQTIAAGSYHSLAVRSDGAVFAWGFNELGQLGIGRFSLDEITPTRVVGPLGGGVLSDIGAIDGGLAHTLAVRNSDGSILAWGSNTNAQLGTGTFEWFRYPVPIIGLAAMIAVQAGRLHSLAMGRDGSLYAWGDNTFGQLGVATAGSTQGAPMRMDAFGGERLLSLAAGDNHSLVATEGGGLYAWGRNLSGELGDGTLVNRPAPVLLAFGNVAQVTAGGNYTLAFTQPFL
jgi:alpha-tubulin suppressor-like RCC1 family protein